ncbi:MAG: hypothetical protein M1821_001469 [Bathelium mastoideum]|nr:MAG: hypothetical protein M1821_001469 [Bathelium mastoideum]
MSRAGPGSGMAKKWAASDEEYKKTTIGGVPVPWVEDPALATDAAPAHDFPRVSLPHLAFTAPSLPCHLPTHPLPPLLRSEAETPHSSAAMEWWNPRSLGDQQPEETPRPNPPRRNERIAVARYRTLRDRIRDGPLYTILGHGVRVGKAPPPVAATFDPFGGQPTYSSQRFRKHRRRIPQLHTRPYVLQFFPKELHSTLDPTQKDDSADAGIEDASEGAQPSKKLGIALGRKLSRLQQVEEEADTRTVSKPDEIETNEQELLANNDDEDENGERRDDELLSDLQDDDFGDAEEDDYEQNYFDNGEDEDFGDDGGPEDFGGAED